MNIIFLLTKFNKITTQNKTVAAINYSKKSDYLCLRKLEKLRDQFKKIIFYTTDSSSTLDKQFKQAEKLNPRYILYFGDDEISSNKYTIKDFKSGEKQEKLTEDELSKKLSSINE